MQDSNLRAPIKDLTVCYNYVQIFSIIFSTS